MLSSSTSQSKTRKEHPMPRRTTDARFFESLEQRQVLAANLIAIPGAPLPANHPGIIVATGAADQFGNVAGDHDVTLHAVLGTTPVDFELHGPGNGKVKYLNGGYVVNLTGTTGETKVTIHAHPAPGAAQPAIRAINIPRSIDHLDIDKVRITASIGIGGTAAKLDLGDVSSSTITIGGAGDKLDVKADAVSNTTLISATPLHDLHAKAWTGVGRIEAPYAHDIHSDGALSAGILLTGMDDHGDSLHDLHIQGTAGAIVARGDLNDVEVGSLSSARINLAGQVHNLHVKGNIASSFIAVRSVNDLHIDGNVTSSQIAAGAAFGNATPSQIFSAAKTLRWNDGSIDHIDIHGNVASSSFTAGVRPVVGLWRDGNDQFVAGATGGFNHIDIHGTFINSGFEAPSFPDHAKLADRDVDTAADARFNSHLA
jgi:hypothetical protein